MRFEIQGISSVCQKKENICEFCCLRIDRRDLVLFFSGLFDQSSDIVFDGCGCCLER